MTPSPKDRQNSGISMLEAEQAGAHLNAALRAVYANIGPSPVLVEIRAAMAMLGIQETPPDNVRETSCRERADTGE